MADFGMGLVPSPPDDRDQIYAMERVDPSLMAIPLSALPRYKYWARGPLLNQGNTPHCVGFSFEQWKGSSPLRSSTSNTGGHDIYAACKAIDGYPGDGTYIRAGAKVMQNQGRVETYVWAFNIDTMIHWLLQRGPVVVGTIWTEDMFDPSGWRQVLKPTGAEAGGHAYIIRGYNQDTRYFRIVNSWGPYWGDNGQASIHFDDFMTLLNRGAEILGAIEKRP